MVEAGDLGARGAGEREMEVVFDVEEEVVDEALDEVLSRRARERAPAHDEYLHVKNCGIEPALERRWWVNLCMSLLRQRLSYYAMRRRGRAYRVPPARELLLSAARAYSLVQHERTPRRAVFRDTVAYGVFEVENNGQRTDAGTGTARASSARRSSKVILIESHS